MWISLPVLAGAGIGDGDLWAVGGALCLIAIASLETHRLVTRAAYRPPERVSPTADGDLVATSGTPTRPGDVDVRTLVTGRSAVYVDWLVQQRRTLEGRHVWDSLASEVRSTAFTSGDGTVRLDDDRLCVFSSASDRVSAAPEMRFPTP
ncbi:hypothetical protein [Halopiger djelfimassiliensis]|uniref:hypothetical protein n=1 Tax=Halopiger djelfimassiliensis TaxID=1293047 RepID=UPI000677B368|nr:hypothetical protein [Halopiger djelfimassiliensis]